MEFEHDIIKFFQSNMTVGWLDFFQLITLFGSFLGCFITFVIVFSKDKRLGFVLLLTFVVGSVINHFLKAIIARPRPFDSYSDIINYGNEDGYSMPSGHSLCTGIFATFLIYILFNYSKDKWTKFFGTIFITILSATILLSRMVLGVHYFTDVLAGIIVGVLFAIFAIIMYNLIRKKIKRKTT